MFRPSAFQNILDEAGITSIGHWKEIEYNMEDNVFSKAYSTCHTANGDNLYDVYTDGTDKEYVWERTDDWDEKFPGTPCWKARVKMSFKNPSWIVIKHVDTYADNRARTCVLYCKDSKKTRDILRMIAEKGLDFFACDKD